MRDNGQAEARALLPAVVAGQHLHTDRAECGQQLQQAAGGVAARRGVLLRVPAERLRHARAQHQRGVLHLHTE